MDEQVKVRFGVPEDLDQMMDLALLCTEENGLLKPSVTKILNEMWASLHNHGGLVGVIADENGHIEAGMVIRVDTMSYSEEPVLCERAIFVHPDFRSAKGGRASRLCEFAKMVSDRMNMPLLIGVLSSERAAGKVRLYERHFGEPSGAYWLYHGKTGQNKAAAE